MKVVALMPNAQAHVRELGQYVAHTTTIAASLFTLEASNTLCKVCYGT